MGHLVGIGPHIGRDRLAGQRRPRRNTDEAQRGLSRNDPHVVATLREFPQDMRRLVGRDAARDAEHYPRPAPAPALGTVARTGATLCVIH